MKIFSVGTVAAMSGQLAHRDMPESSFDALIGVPFEDLDTSTHELAKAINLMSTPAPNSSVYLQAFEAVSPSESVPQAIQPASESPDLQQYLAKMRYFEHPHREDIFLDKDRYPLLISTFKRLDRVQNIVGHGNFNVVGFDEMLQYGRRYSSVGEFSGQEKDFLEELFSVNASQYGFLGKKVITELTAPIPEKLRTKVRETGHFLYRGESELLYGKLKKDVGDSIVLTSGIRSVVKQSYLFLAKTIQSKGNLSQASRSLAPPGHSYHGVGDFDVGRVGYGRKNFTEEFATTDEFKKLVDLGYVAIRYPRENGFGVRYEPWHIKVV